MKQRDVTMPLNDHGKPRVIGGSPPMMIMKFFNCTENLASDALGCALPPALQSKCMTVEYCFPPILDVFMQMASYIWKLRYICRSLNCSIHLCICMYKSRYSYIFDLLIKEIASLDFLLIGSELLSIKVFLRFYVFVYSVKSIRTGNNS